ncbi:MAG: hypothetical protein ACREOO_16805 [bacterium]
MNWQEFIVFAIVLVAAIYAGRTFWQQFSFGKKPEHKHCDQCGPGKKASHHPLQSFTRKPS